MRVGGRIGYFMVLYLVIFTLLQYSVFRIFIFITLVFSFMYCLLILGGGGGGAGIDGIVEYV